MSRTIVITGASDGIGAAAARQLHAAGEHVVVVGRHPDKTRAVAESIGAPWHLADYADLDQVRELAQRLRSDYGRIDLLVNDIWGAELLKGGPAQWNTPIWEHDLEDGLRILRLAIDTHLITSHHLLPLLITQPGGLLVEMTDGTTDYNAGHYRISVYYDLAKVAVNRLAFSQGHELATYGVTAVAVTPGWLRSEMMLDNYQVREDNWQDALELHREGGKPTAPPGFIDSESPIFVGRGVAALASDALRQEWNQRSVTSAELARRYGFADVDGRQPDGWAGA